MKKLIYTKFIDANGQEQERVFEFPYQLHSCYFNPDVVELETIFLESQGKGYKERKEHIAQLAQYFKDHNCAGLKASEHHLIAAFFEQYAKTYGLRKLFVECNILAA